MYKFLTTDSPEFKSLSPLLQQYNDCVEDIEQIAGADFPLQEISANLRIELAQHAEEARALLAYKTRPGDVTPLPQLSVGFLSLLFGDEVENRIIAALRNSVVDPGLPKSARPKAIADKKAQLAAIDRAIEHETCQLEQQGFVVVRRMVDSDTHDELAYGRMLLEQWDEA